LVADLVFIALSINHVNTMFYSVLRQSVKHLTKSVKHCKHKNPKKPINTTLLKMGVLRETIQTSFFLIEMFYVKHSVQNLEVVGCLT